MNDFTNASAGASISIQNSRTNASLQIAASLDSINASNSTATQLSSTISLACATNPTNSSYNSQFHTDCTSGGSYIGFATTDLKQASLLLVTSETSQSASVIGQAENWITDANGNLSLAATVISQLSQFSYAQRAQEYIAGPLASSLTTANDTVLAQKNLVASFGADFSSYQAFSSQQTSAIGSIESAATSTSSAASTASTGLSSVSTSSSSEQVQLSQVATDMSELSIQIPAALPSNLLSQLQADISSVQSATTTSSNSISGLQSGIGSFNQVTLNSLSSFSGTFQIAFNTAESNNQALLTSCTSLQTELDSLANEFPLLTILGTWYTTLTNLDQSLSSSIPTLSFICANCGE